MDAGGHGPVVSNPQRAHSSYKLRRWYVCHTLYSPVPLIIPFQSHLFGTNCPPRCSTTHRTFLPRLHNNLCFPKHPSTSTASVSYPPLPNTSLASPQAVTNTDTHIRTSSLPSPSTRTVPFPLGCGCSWLFDEINFPNSHITYSPELWSNAIAWLRSIRNITSVNGPKTTVRANVNNDRRMGKKLLRNTFASHMNGHHFPASPNRRMPRLWQRGSRSKNHSSGYCVWPVLYCA
jgi:hypothetical protein